MTIAGSVADWETWTGMKFPDGGSYVVPGALNPIQVDIETGQALYVEPNVWTLHSLQ